MKLGGECLIGVRNWQDLVASPRWFQKFGQTYGHCWLRCFRIPKHSNGTLWHFQTFRNILKRVEAVTIVRALLEVPHRP